MAWGSEHRAGRSRHGYKSNTPRNRSSIAARAEAAAAFLPAERSWKWLAKNPALPLISTAHVEMIVASMVESTRTNVHQSRRSSPKKLHSQPGTDVAQLEMAESEHLSVAHVDDLGVTPTAANPAPNGFDARTL